MNWGYIVGYGVEEFTEGFDVDLRKGYLEK